MITAWWLLHCRSEAKAQALKARVKALDEQERLRRLRMENMGVHVSLRAGKWHSSCILQATRCLALHRQKA